MGILDPATQAARVTSTIYYPGNTLSGTSAGDYDIRDTADHNFRVPIAEDGVVDMGIALNHTLDSEVRVKIYVVFDLSLVGGSSSSQGVQLFQTAEGDNDMIQGGRYVFLPEVSLSPGLTSTTKLYAIPELRGPVDALMVRLVARTTPTTGSANMRLIRRY